MGADAFAPGTTFAEIRLIYEADEALRTALRDCLFCAGLARPQNPRDHRA